MIKHPRNVALQNFLLEVDIYSSPVLNVIDVADKSFFKSKANKKMQNEDNLPTL